MPNVVQYLPTPSKVNLTPLYVGGGIVIAYFGYKAIKSFLDKQNAKIDLTKDQSTDIKADVKGKDKSGKKLLDLNGKPITSVNLALIATDIYNGLHPGWYKPTEQDRVVRAFKNTPFGYVKDLEKIYLEKYGENLKETLAEKLSETNFIKIKYFFAY